MLPFRNSERWLWWLCAVVGAITPVLASSLLVWYGLGGSWRNFMPVWNDEIIYWHEVLSFVHYGSRGGYYTVEEVLPKIVLPPVSVHAPFFKLLYGAVGKVVGWGKTSAPFFNMASIFLALIGALVVTRPRLSQLVCFVAAVAVFWPVLLFVPTNMQESLHHSFAILLAALVFRLLNPDESPPPYLLVATLLLIAMAALTRPTWALLFPAVVLATPHTFWGMKRNTALFLSVLLTGFFFAVVTLLAAPYPDGFHAQFLASLRISLKEASTLFVGHFLANVSVFLGFSKATLLETGLRWALLLAIVSLGFSCCAVNAGEKSCEHTKFSLYNLLFILLILLVLSDVGDWRDVRAFSPHLLLTLLLFVLCRDNFKVYGSLLVFVLGLPFFYKAYVELHRPHFFRDVDLTGYMAPVIREIRYDQTQGPWGNSLLIDIACVQYFLLDLPPGIGMSGVIDWNRMTSPIKSRYLFVLRENFRRLDRERFKLLAMSPMGGLFLNLHPQDSADQE